MVLKVIKKLDSDNEINKDDFAFSNGRLGNAGDIFWVSIYATQEDGEFKRFMNSASPSFEGLI